jgi:dihydroorotate dehydrogenase
MSAAAAYGLVRPLLLRLDPEQAHALSLRLLQAAHTFGLLRAASAGAPVSLLGLTFANRLGLAAGFDKNGVCIDAAGALGFAFVEVGTVTPLPQPGNARPRLFRLAPAEAIINRLGFPSAGVAALCARLERRAYRGVCGINIGKNAATPLERASDDYLACLEAVYPLADYVALNISSPNTAGLRALQQEQHLRPLLERLLESRSRLATRHGRRVPLLVKLSPDLSAEELTATAALLVGLGVDGVIATNTTLTRPQVAGLPQAAESGGLSGPPLRPLAVQAIRTLRAALGARVPLIGVGGIDSPAAAREVLGAGADLIQVYTALVYRGPALVRELAQVEAAARVA